MDATAQRAWRREWQRKVRLAVNDFNRADKQWKDAVRDGALAAAGVGNAAVQEDSLPTLDLGVLADVPNLNAQLAAALCARGAAALANLRAAAGAAADAAALARAAADALAPPPATPPLPVFASLGLPTIAACFDRAAALFEAELAVKAAVAADAGDMAGAAGAAGRLRGDDLRQRLTVLVTAWKLQPCLGPADAPGLEVAPVVEDMAGF